MKNNASKSRNKNKRNFTNTISKNTMTNNKLLTASKNSQTNNYKNSVTGSTTKSTTKISNTQSLKNSKNFNNNKNIITISNDKINSNKNTTKKNNSNFQNKNNLQKNKSTNNLAPSSIKELQSINNNENKNNNFNNEEKLWKKTVALRKTMQLTPEELARILALKKNQEKNGTNINRWHNKFIFEEIVKDPNDEPKSANKLKKIINPKSARFRSNTLNNISKGIMSDLNFNNNDIDISDSKSNSQKKNINEKMLNSNIIEYKKLKEKAKIFSNKEKKKINKELVKQKITEFKYNILKDEAKQPKKIDKYKILISTEKEMKELYDNLKNKNIKKKIIKNEEKEKANKNEKNIKENVENSINEEDDKIDFDTMRRQFCCSNIYTSTDFYNPDTPLYQTKFLDDYVEGKCPSLMNLLSCIRTCRTTENNNKEDISKNPLTSRVNYNTTKYNISKNDNNMGNFDRMETAKKFYNILNGNVKTESNKKEGNETDRNFFNFSYNIFLNSVDNKLKSLKNKNYDLNNNNLYNNFRNYKINNKKENNNLRISFDDKKNLQKHRKLQELNGKIKQMQKYDGKNNSDYSDYFLTKEIENIKDSWINERQNNCYDDTILKNKSIDFYSSNNMKLFSK